MVHQALEFALISMAEGCLQCLANSDCQCICDPCMDKMCPPKKASEGNEQEAECEYIFYDLFISFISTCLNRRHSLPGLTASM
jgi:hypothetical protein